MPTGSSPLARGLPRQAGAGGDECLDHPRSRGVYPAVTAYGLRVGGSSPLARGLPGVELGPPSPEGIIPARAGFTLGHERQAGPPADHPRSRGVYRLPVRALNTRRGSSPLARGLRRVPQARIRQQGIIPARAGFTAGGASPPPAPGDHPRSRGVYDCVRATKSHAKGSSPLARGLLGRASGHDEAGRIIPARAGFTRTCGRVPGASPDHPRSRGVYFHSVSAPDLIAGSSPLARGLLTGFLVGLRDAGIIPARAGFTRG